MKSQLLIVDDEPHQGRLVGTLATKMGFATDVAGAVVEFREKFIAVRPTLVVTDLMMPDEDGLEVLKFLAAQEYDGPVLIMTGADTRVANSAIRFGRAHGLRMAGRIAKPIDMDDLTAKLTEYRLHARAIEAGDLVDAIRKRQIEVFYQPKINFKSGHLTGVEALVRWRHPDLGIVSPDRFIPLIEAEGGISPLTDCVMGIAFADVKALHDLGYRLSVAINLSPVVLREPDLTKRIEAAAAKVGIEPETVVFEITESAAMTDPVMIMEVLTRLRLRGFGLSIDDFGTGYSSLAELRRLPFGEMKVDCSFVMDMFEDDDAPVIVRSIIALAKALGMDVVAEGVETAQTFEALNAMGCDICQGFFFGKPEPIQSLLSRLQTGDLVTA